MPVHRRRDLRFRGHIIADAAAAEIFGRDPHVIGAGAVYPFGRAVATPGGHIVNGRWSYSSGCQHSSWLTVFCHVLDVDTPRPDETGARQRFGSPSCLPREATIHDTWDVSGLAALGATTSPSSPSSFLTSSAIASGLASPGQRLSGPALSVPVLGDFRGCRSELLLSASLKVLSTCCMDIAQGEDGVAGPTLLSAIVRRFRPSSARPWHRLRSARAWLHVSVDGSLGCHDRRGIGFAGRTDGSRSWRERMRPIPLRRWSARSTRKPEETANYRRSPFQRALRDIHAATHTSGRPALVRGDRSAAARPASFTAHIPCEPRGEHEGPPTPVGKE